MRPPRFHLALVAAVLVVTGVAVAGCGGSTAATTTTTTVPATTTTTVPATTTVPEETTTTVPETTTTTEAPAGDVTIPLPGVSAMGAAWTEAFLLPYGTADDQVGTAPGGDNGSLDLGPDYGAQAPDGTWWILDAAKLRLAHFSEGGEFLAAVPLQPDQLIDGRYFQFQLPHVLDDGTLVASRLGSESSTLLVLDGEQAHLVTVPTMFVSEADDGVMLDGFDDLGDLVEVDAHSGEATVVDWFRTRAGTRYRVEARGDVITVELPDTAAAPVTLHLVWADDPSVTAYAGVEVDSGADGSLFLFLYGSTDGNGGGQLAGFLTISPQGAVSEIEPTQDPFSPSDPGSPAHLGVRPGTSSPWLMFVDTDGVRVFTRS
jgi:hypothetical protein